MVIKLLRCQRIFNSVNYCQYLVHRVWDINVRKTAVRLFSIRKYLAAVLIFTILRIAWLHFPRVPSQHSNLLGPMAFFSKAYLFNLLAWRNAFRISLCWGPCLRLALLPQESRHKYCVLTCNFTFKCFKNKALSYHLINFTKLNERGALCIKIIA